MINTNQPFHFRTKSWAKINNGTMYNTNSQIKFKTTILNSISYQAYIQFKGVNGTFENFLVCRYLPKNSCFVRLPNNDIGSQMVQSPVEMKLKYRSKKYQSL